MQIEDPRPRWGLVVFVLLLLVVLAGLPFFLLRSQTQELPNYEIQNFIGEVSVYTVRANGWAPAQRGGTLKAGDKIRTAAKGEVDLRIPNQIQLRIKENSEIEVRKPGFFDRSLRYRLYLVKGSLIGNTDKQFEGKRLEISTPVMVAAVRGTTFQIEMDSQTNQAVLRVLEGSVKVKGTKSWKTITVKELEKTEVTKGKTAKPLKITRQEWNQLKEGYELREKSAAMEAIQLDLSKEAGSLFKKFVFDHGTFFTPNFGFADREFIHEKDSGKVFFKLSYDVFPAGSFVGMYIKTRYLDLAKFKGISFQIRGNAEEGYPQAVKIEFKNGSSIVRAFVPRDFKETWQTVEYPLRFTRAAPITEVTFVVSNEKSGDHKKGAIYVQDFNLIPADKPVAGAKPKAAKPAPTSEPVTATSPADTTQPS